MPASDSDKGEEFVDDGSSEDGSSEDAGADSEDFGESDTEVDPASPAVKAKPRKAPAKAAAKSGASNVAASPAASSVSATPGSKGKGKKVAAAAGAVASGAAAAAAKAAKSPKSQMPRKSIEGSVSTTPQKAKPAAKKSTGGGGSSGAGPTDPKSALFNYMRQVNRPYSVINMFDNLQKKIPKALVQKLADQLVAEGQLCAQEYGKAKIYYMNQQRLVADMGDASQAHLGQLAAEAKALSAELAAAEAVVRSATMRAVALAGQPTDTELGAGVVAAEGANAALADKNAGIKRAHEGSAAGAAAAQPDALKRARRDFNAMRAVWAERRRNCAEVLDEMATGMNCRIAECYDKVGVENDVGGIPAKMHTD